MVKKQWHNCKYMISPLGVTLCKKMSREEYETCKRDNCDEIEYRELLMLSYPMKGKSREEVEKIRDEMIDVIFDKLGDTYIIMDTIIKDIDSKTELECFAESVYHLSQSETLLMGEGWEESRGCKLEHDIAKAYGLKIIYFEEIK